LITARRLYGEASHRATLRTSRQIKQANATQRRIRDGAFQL
jgi:hypothetical protein